MFPSRKELGRVRLTTAEILYHLPDYPQLLQTYIWQGLDHAPHFPALNKFLTFWEENLDGRLHSVTVANTRLRVPRGPRFACAVSTLH